LIRASVEDAQRINDWVWRDSGNRPDFTAFLSDRLNVCLIEGEGGALFVWRGPGIYEVHVFFEQRGKEVIRLSRQMLDYMRENGARLFWAAVPTITQRHHVHPPHGLEITGLWRLPARPLRTFHRRIECPQQ
jgi:hypothetical protein